VARGTARDRGCARLARVTVTVRTRMKHRRCRYLGPDGRLGKRARCRRGPRLLAHGTAHWRLSVRAKLPPGRYVLVARAVDSAGNEEKARKGTRLRVRRR